MKKQVYALLAVVAMTILAGCGKSNNGAGVVGYGISGAGLVSVGGIGGSGQCYQVQPGVAATLTFSGQLDTRYSGITSYMSASNVGVAGNGYVHQYQGSGDTLQVYVNGAQTYAVATLSASTTSAVALYYGGFVCAIGVNSDIGVNNTLGQGAYLYGLNGRMNLSI